MLRRGWMKRAESFLDLERIEFPFTWWYIQSVSKNKMEQQTPIPHQIKDEAARKLRRAIFPSLIWEEMGGSRFSICLSNNVASGKPLSRKIFLLSAQLKSSLQFPLLPRSFFFFFGIQVVYAHSSIPAPVESNKLNNKYERFGWWNYTRRNF